MASGTPVILAASNRSPTRAFDEIEVAAVIINDVPSLRVDSMPPTSRRDQILRSPEATRLRRASHREGIRWAIEEMTELRTMVMKG